MKRVQSFEDTRRRRSRILRRIRFLAVLFLFYELISVFLVKSYMVGSRSMDPTLFQKDRVIVLTSAYGVHNPMNRSRISFKIPDRGDIVLMDLPSAGQYSALARLGNALVRFLTVQRVGLSRSHALSEKPVILRIVAIPGDSVRMDGFVVYVKPGGQDHYLTEYEVSSTMYDIDSIQAVEGWDEKMPLSGNFPPIELGPDEFFVAGDNRVASSDSRFFGPVSSNDFIGRVVARYWPLDRLSGL